MRRYDLYLFDFDLTLAETRSVIVKCFLKTLKEFGLPPKPFHEIAALIGLPMEYAAGVVMGTKDEEKIRRFCKAYTPYADRYMVKGTSFLPGALAALRELKRRGAKVGIVSSKTSHRILASFERYGATDLIDHIVGSHEVTKKKPDPEPLNMALEHFGIKKEAALYVGDHLVDAEAARNAGVDFAAVLTGNNVASDFYDLPHRAILKTVSDVPHILRP